MILNTYNYMISVESISLHFFLSQAKYYILNIKRQQKGLHPQQIDFQTVKHGLQAKSEETNLYRLHNYIF